MNRTSDAADRALLATAAAAMLLQVVLVFGFAPEAAGFRAPLTQRIFYYHVPIAWAAYVAFGVTALASLLVLRGGPAAARHDTLARAGAEVGTLFSLVALLTGLVWARQEFLDYDPFRDAKVISLVVLILAYLAYFALRANVADRPRRRRLAAVFGLLALLGVPLSYLASRASVHPDFTRTDEGLDPRLGVHLAFSLAAFTLLAAALVRLRARLAALEEALDDLEEST